MQEWSQSLSITETGTPAALHGMINQGMDGMDKSGKPG